MTEILAVPFITLCLQGEEKSPTSLINLQTGIPMNLIVAPYIS